MDSHKDQWCKKHVSSRNFYVLSLFLIHPSVSPRYLCRSLHPFLLFTSQELKTQVNHPSEPLVSTWCYFKQTKHQMPLHAKSNICSGRARPSSEVFSVRTLWQDWHHPLGWLGYVRADVVGLLFWPRRDSIVAERVSRRIFAPWQLTARLRGSHDLWRKA